MHRPIQGIIPALHTAFDAHEELDLGVQAELIRRLLSQGVHGLFVCGTSAEFPFLTVEEREQIAELALSEASGEASIAVHVGAMRPRDSLRLAQHAARLGADAVSSVPPFYYHYRPRAIVDYFRELSASTALPCYYYHIPERTGVQLDERLLEKLLQEGKVVGMKYSHGDLLLEQRLLQVAGPGFQVLCGSDELLLPSLVIGAAGGVGSTYNFLAPLFVRLWDAYRDGKLSEASALQRQANRLISLLWPYPPLAASKEALRLLGIDLGPPRAPQSRLEKDEQCALQQGMFKTGLAELDALQ